MKETYQFASLTLMLLLSCLILLVCGCGVWPRYRFTPRSRVRRDSISLRRPIIAARAAAHFGKRTVVIDLVSIQQARSL